MAWTDAHSGWHRRTQKREGGKLTQQAVGGGIDEGHGGDDGTARVPGGVSDAQKTRVSKERQ